VTGAWLKSLGLGLAAAVIAATLWLTLGSRFAGTTVTAPISSPSTPPKSANAGAPDDVVVTTTDTVVQTTTYSDSRVAWVGLAAMILFPGWNLRRLRKC